MMTYEAIFKRTAIPVAAKGLDANSMRMKAIANNVANISSIGYQKIEVSFEDQLKKALDPKQLRGVRTQEAHIGMGRPLPSEVNPKGYRSQDPNMYGEINNVDIDMEMSGLAESQLAYDTEIRLVKDQLTAITSAIKMRG